jgi:hypothetical protein
LGFCAKRRLSVSTSGRRPFTLQRKPRVVRGRRGAVELEVTHPGQKFGLIGGARSIDTKVEEPASWTVCHI